MDEEAVFTPAVSGFCLGFADVAEETQDILDEDGEEAWMSATLAEMFTDGAFEEVDALSFALLACSAAAALECAGAPLCMGLLVAGDACLDEVSLKEFCAERVEDPESAVQALVAELALGQESRAFFAAALADLVLSSVAMG